MKKDNDPILILFATLIALGIAAGLFWLAQMVLEWLYQLSASGF